MASAGYTPTKGDKVWIACDDTTTEAYTQCTVKEVVDNKVTCFDKDYKQFVLPVANIFPVNPPHMEGVRDNTELMYLQDPSLLHNVRVRYSKDEIYTYTAYILIAVNPYKPLSLYGPDVIKQYAGQPMNKLPPHVYAVADRCFRSLKGSKRNQSIVVSGESGAGKTESCKHIMRFLASVGGEGPIGTIDELEQKILDANPILEAFGNAKTLRNNNSSRFGKFTELHFNSNVVMVGASIETYLLEKSRLVSQAKGERCFHIFYQIIKGAPAPVKSMAFLTNVADYEYLRMSGCDTIENVDDAREFQVVSKAMTGLGIDANDQQALINVMSALLHMGNIKFVQNDQDISLLPASQASLQAVGRLFGLNVDVLQNRMTTRVMRIGGPSREPITITLSGQEANYARDSLAKFIYGELFNWLVRRINESVPGKSSSNFIGILDISGFEIFEANSFEQLCINFANEKIQQYFNKQILQQEQEIYELEGLRYRKVEYQDNQEIIDLVENKQKGVFALLNEECLMPKATDKTFSLKVHTNLAGNKYLSKPVYGKKQKKRLNDDEAFVVKHFAGEVVYETAHFLDKNNDTIHDELISMLSDSTVPFMQLLFPKAVEEECAYGAMGGRFKSVSNRFQTQLSKLMTKLESTVSHFIRCIKPNGLQAPGVFNPKEVLVQLRYSGMCAALEQQLQAERANTAQVWDDLELALDEVDQTKTALAGSKDEAAKLRALLKQMETENAQLKDALRTEKHGREDDVRELTRKLEEARNKAALDNEVKDAIIGTLKNEKKDLEAKLVALKKQMDSRSEEYANQLKQTQEENTILRAELKSMTERFIDLDSKIEHLERERPNLIQKAIKCQEAQLKLRHIYDGFTKEEDLLRIIHGDDSFATIARTASRVGQLLKQGGSDSSKWQERQVVINENFLVYYSGTKDKHPKGVIRLDVCRVEKADFEKLSKKATQYGFKLTTTTTGREFFFAANSDDERNEWITQIDFARQ